MNLSYSVPLRQAWARAQRMLFRPFRFETWLVLGFAAFLADLGFGHVGNRYNYHGDGESVTRAGRHAERLLHDPFWVLLIVGAVLVGIAIAVVLLWVSARGQFVYLDDVAHERPAIKEPWRRHAALGDSLFLWSLVFGLAVVAVFGLLAVPLVAAFFPGGFEHGFVLPRIAAVLGVVLAAIPLAIVALYVRMLLLHFIVPIMYRDGLTATRAWARFMPLLRQHLGGFVLYGVFLLLLSLVLGVAIVVFGFVTLCIGFLALALPYVGTVLLLPVLVTFRALGPEFLAQFGSEFAVFPAAPAPAGGSVPPAAPPASPVARA